MTYEGRLHTHLNSLRLGKPSPYAEEFKDYKELVAEEKKPSENGSKQVKRGKKKNG